MTATERPEPTDSPEAAAEAKARAERRFLTELSAKLGALTRAIDQVALPRQQARSLAEDARARWRAEHPAPPPPLRARTVRERLAEVYAPKVALAEHPRRGRILLTTAPLEPGEVVVAEEPIAVAYDDHAAAAAHGPLAAALSMVEALFAAGDRGALADDLAHAHADKALDVAARIVALRDAGLSVAGTTDPAAVARLIGIVWTNAFAYPSAASSDPAPTANAASETPAGEPAAAEPPGEAHPVPPEPAKLLRARCLLAVIAMASHSCEPNTTVAFDRDLAFVHALRRIEPGEEVSLAYVPTTMPAVARLAKLAWGYGFVCDCRRCASLTPEDLAQADLGAEEDTESLTTPDVRRAFASQLAEALRARARERSRG